MKRTFLPLVLFALFALGGCKIVIQEDDGGGDTYDDGGGDTYDDGGSGGGGAYAAEPEPEPEPEPQPRRARARRTVKKGPQRTFVGGYRSQYSHLPNLGETKKYMMTSGTAVQLDKGYMRGTWKCGARGYVKQGAGKGRTVIDGHLEIKGNNWVLKQCTVTGNVEIRGNNNDISGLEVLGRIDVRGMGNKTP